MGRPITTDDRMAVEWWWTTVIDPANGEITVPGCLLLRFAPNGRCRDRWSTGRSSRADKTRPTVGVNSRKPTSYSLTKGTRRSTLDELADWTLWADQVITF
jgi:hypothetical protein